jgi:hypothetical protein
MADATMRNQQIKPHGDLISGKGPIGNLGQKGKGMKPSASYDCKNKTTNKTGGNFMEHNPGDKKRY